MLPVHHVAQTRRALDDGREHRKQPQRNAFHIYGAECANRTRVPALPKRCCATEPTRHRIRLAFRSDFALRQISHRHPPRLYIPIPCFRSKSACSSSWHPSQRTSHFVNSALRRSSDHDHTLWLTFVAGSLWCTSRSFHDLHFTHGPCSCNHAARLAFRLAKSRALLSGVCILEPIG